MPRQTPLWLLALLLGASSPANAQATAEPLILKGRVLDAATKEPVPFASVWLRTGRTFTMNTKTGYFRIDSPEPLVTDTLMVEALGYRPSPDFGRFCHLPPKA